MEARLQNALSDNVNNLALASQPFTPKMKAESVFSTFPLSLIKVKLPFGNGFNSQRSGLGQNCGTVGRGAHIRTHSQRPLQHLTVSECD